MSTWPAHTLDLKEIIIRSYLEREATRICQVIETFEVREIFPPLTFIGGVGADSQRKVGREALDHR